MPTLRRKRLPNGTTPRAAISWTLHPLSDAVDVGKRKPQLLLYVRNYCDFHRRNWKQCLRHTGLVVAETVALGDEDEHGHCRTLVCRVVGTADQLEAAVCYPSVEKWEYVLNARVPLAPKCDEAGIPYVLRVTAPGAGPEKIRAKHKVRTPKWYGTDEPELTEGLPYPEATMTPYRTGAADKPVEFEYPYYVENIWCNYGLGI